MLVQVRPIVPHLRFVSYCCNFCVFFFFFSSRRRHTRFDCDWSSDVCSSDLCCYLYSQFIPVIGACFESQLCWRSEEHTSELQSQSNLVCRLLLEKKKDEYRCPTQSGAFFDGANGAILALSHFVRDVRGDGDR